MHLEQSVRLVAGIFVLGGVLLAYFSNAIWLILPAYVATEMIYSGIADWCPTIAIMEGMGFQRR